MKVLTIGTDRKLFEDGSAVFTRQAEYAEKMEELHIVVFSLKKQGLKEIHKGNLHIYPTNSNTRISYVFDAVKMGEKIIKGNDFVLSAQDPFETGLVGYKLKKKFSLPLQLQIHTDFLSPYFKNSFLNRIRAVIAKRIIPKADGMRVVSSVISDSLKKSFPDLKAKIDVLPIFVDVNKFFGREVKYYTPEKSFSVLMVSRFTKEKRIDIGLEAFRKVVDQDKNVNMLLVGSGPEKKNIDKKITELNLWSNMQVLEWEKDVVQVYRKADIFLLTSEYEGYGMTLIEAGASGCPIVTTKVGVAKTDLFKNGENSFVCPVGDVSCLAESIIKLISNPSKLQLFSEQMQDSIRKTAMTKEQYIEKYAALLQSLI